MPTQAEAAPAGAPPNQAVQPMVAHLAQGNGVGARGWLVSSCLGMQTVAPTGEKHLKITPQLQMNVARFLLRDGNKVGAEVSLEGLEVLSYTDQKGEQVHALATTQAEREFLKRVPSKLLPLYVRMEQALAKVVGRS